jgi:L-amino acid N-acyltransferase YncA
MTLIRSATVADAPALLAIYAPYVERTAVSFETEIPTVDTFSERIGKALTAWDWLVAEDNGQCVGYAYGSTHRERQAYQWSVETSAYVHEHFQRQGVASLLYSTLLQRLSAKGYCNAFAGIALPNAASVAFHEHLGFAPIGVFKRVGRKFDGWHDVAWFNKVLRESPPPEL